MINLNHLKYFYDVCLTKSFTESAKRNFISHSAISQAIKNVESYYNVELMIHKKNFFELTDDGKLLFENIQPIFDAVKLSKNIIENQNKEIVGDLNLGCSYSMALSFIPDVLKIFSKKYPKINHSLKLNNSINLFNEIINRNIEVGVGIDDGQFFKLESRLVKKGKFVFASSKKDVDIKDEVFLIGDKGEEVIKFKQFYQKNNLSNKVIEIESWEVISRFIQNGMGIGLIPDYILNSTFANKLYPVDFGIKLPQYELKCFFRDEKYLSRNANLFLEQIVQV